MSDTIIDTKFRFFIAVREWFDKTYGNSYFSLRVWDAVTGQKAVVPMTYGHGYDTYLRAAANVMACKMEQGEVVVDCTTVTRRKDLHTVPKWMDD